MSQGGAFPALGALAFVVVLLGSACASKPPAAVQTAAAADGGSDASAANESDGDGDGDAEGETAAAASDTTDEGSGERPNAGPCPAEMALIEIATPAPRRFCIDRYEASLVEVMSDGTEQPFAHYVPVDGHDVRAVSKPHAFPQGYISEVQAQDACGASGKRLCNHDEWKTACMGTAHTTFPYGDARRPGACHDTGKSAVIAVFGAKAVAASTPSPSIAAANAPKVAASRPADGKRVHSTKGRAAQSTRARAASSKTATKATAKAPPKKGTHRTGKKSTRPASVDPGVWAKLNDPGLGQVDGALAKTGEHAECVNDFGVYDMVGNLHEWVATDPAAPHGTFAGGYYLDTTLNGDGCNYRTVAHAHDYHDYSTGFRCCAAASPTPP
jgi:hypothetical protein